MSGGHYGYIYHKFSEMADLLNDDLAAEGAAYSPEVTKLLKEFEKTLRLISEQARAVEWFMSCDIGEDSLLQRFDEIRRKGNE